MEKRLDFLEQYEVYGFEENIKSCQKLFSQFVQVILLSQGFERGYFKTLHRVGFFENFSLFLTYNRIGVPYGHDFFTGAKNQSSRTLQIPRTQSLSIQKNFQRPSKKKFHLKNSSFVRIFQSKFELQISKSKLFSLFLTHNRIGAPYGHDFFTGVKNYFR